MFAFLKLFFVDLFTWRGFVVIARFFATTHIADGIRRNGREFRQSRLVHGAVVARNVF